MKPLHTDTRAWYARYRNGGEKAARALYLARIHAEAAQANYAILRALSPASLARVAAFVDDFIRGPEVEQTTAENENDWINDAQRATRVYDAAEYGAGGSTHGEIVNDQREAFRNWLSARRRWTEPERFARAVEAMFTETELWHEFNGSLNQEIG